MNEIIEYRGVYRTAPDTPGLLKMTFDGIIHGQMKHDIEVILAQGKSVTM